MPTRRLSNAPEPQEDYVPIFRAEPDRFCEGVRSLLLLLLTIALACVACYCLEWSL